MGLTVYVARAVKHLSYATPWAALLPATAITDRLFVEPLPGAKYSKSIALSSTQLYALVTSREKTQYVRRAVEKAWGGADPDAIPADLKALLAAGPRVFSLHRQSTTSAYPTFHLRTPIGTDWTSSGLVLVLDEKFSNATPPSASHPACEFMVCATVKFAAALDTSHMFLQQRCLE